MRNLFKGFVALLLLCGVAFSQDQAVVKKVMILGNSITKHGPSAKIDWHYNWGMAATALEKDFSHVLKRYFTEANKGVEPEMVIDNISGFERTHATMDIPATFKKYVDFKPEILILAIGENVPQPKDAETEKVYYDALVKMLGLFKENGAPKLYVRSSFWPNEVKDRLVKQACEWYGGTYVDISALSKDSSNYGRAERAWKHDGVANHPGDKGMRGIADLIWAAYIAKK